MLLGLLFQMPFQFAQFLVIELKNGQVQINISLYFRVFERM